MTAVNIIASKRHNCITIATDAATYDDHGFVGEFRSKVHCIPEWSAAITGRGNSFGQDVAVRELMGRASSFDELIGIAARELPLIVHQFKLERPFELNMAGFFKGRPMTFFIRTAGGHDSMAFGSQPYFLLPVGPTLFGPWPSDELIAESGFVEPNPDDSSENIARSLRKLLELQRRTPAEDGFSRVGGFVEITTITPNGIDQQILHRWPEDRVSERMSPAPIDWSSWNREHGF
ncbi:hypothetical protein [Bradyrhizobium sp. 1200_D9_N1_1]|uniref:hypothetical protein n=1 Tax=Bradyrhizobium sp. 1200_D9_N1_1 TaxID=3239013 RepID=UPI003F896A75